MPRLSSSDCFNQPGIERKPRAAHPIGANEFAQFQLIRKTMKAKVKALIACAAVLACVAASVSAQQDATFQTLTGQAVSLSSMRGKVVVLMFSGTQDPQCRDEIKALQSLTERYQNQPVSIYWVSINSPAEASEQQIRSACGTASSVPVLRDANRAAFRAFKGTELPTLVVLNQQGQVSGRPLSGFNPNSDFVNDTGNTISGLLKK